VVAVVLAAGTSSRMGRPKQLLPLGGRPLVCHAVEAALEAGLPVVVVVGHREEEVRAALGERARVRVVRNAGYRSGQASSLRAGLGALGPEVRAALVLLADQPDVSAEAIRAVLHAYRGSGAAAVRARYSGTPGHPVLLDRRIWPEVQRVTGDRGARDLLAAHPEWVLAVDLPGPAPRDIDRWEDYLRASGAAPGSRGSG
jgi:molybdenum cofactor cytidylyltransferase